MSSGLKHWKIADMQICPKQRMDIAHVFFAQWVLSAGYSQGISPSLSAAEPEQRPVLPVCCDRAARPRRPCWCRPGCALSCCALSRCPATTRRWSSGSHWGPLGAAAAPPPRGRRPPHSPPRRPDSRSSRRCTADSGDRRQQFLHGPLSNAQTVQCVMLSHHHPGCYFPLSQQQNRAVSQVLETSFSKGQSKWMHPCFVWVGFSWGWVSG